MRIFLFICLIALILLLFAIGIYLIMGAILYHHYFNKNGKFIKKYNKNLSCDKEFFNDFQDLECESFDKLKLNGKYLNNNSNKLAIMVPSFGDYSDDFTAKIFKDNGYDILALGQRCNGKQSSNELSYGIKESQDLLIWIEKMLKLKSQYKIVLYGQFSGGASIILACEKFPLNVVLVICDSCYDNLEKELKFLFSKNKLFGKIFYKVLSNFAKKSLEFDFKQGDCLKNIKKLKLPILFIHGANDKIVPAEMMYNLSAQVPEMRREIYLCEDCDHLQAKDVAPNVYKEKLKRFLSRYNM